MQSLYVCGTIANYRERLSKIREMRTTGAAEEDIKKEEREASAIKKKLPGITFQATFTESTSAKGRKGVWRKQSAAVLNGLFVCDYDHIEHPKAVYAHWYAEHTELFGDKILLCFITASGRGLKVVAKADVETGNIIDNARALSKILGLETDEACKDASRLSFCPGMDDILYINNELFTYDNKEFEEKFGMDYRNNISASTNKRANGADPNRQDNKGGGVACTTVSDGNKDVSYTAATGQAGENRETESTTVKLETNDKGEYIYKGVRYTDIIEQLAAARGGWPPAGGRHLFTMQMAADLRYICDNDKGALLKIITLCRSAQEIERERGIKEIEDIVATVTGHNLLSYMPKRLRIALESLGVSTAQTSADAENGKTAKIDYQYWWSRLKPLLSAGFAEAVAPFRDEIKLGAVLASGAMFGTYLTKCWWEHYDGERRRLSFLVYIVGDAASGKSFIIDLDKHIMACMRYRDKIGRDWEREYKEDKARRATSRKDQGKESQEIKHPVIRYVPSTISNAKFYQRSMDAVADVQGEEMHLHLYTMESELSTALRAQVGSWAGKLDLECKSFQNEYAGVDYANEQSVNGLIQVNWNQVVSGTMDAMRRKIQPSTVLDGLVTRLALWMMPSNDYQMISRKHVAKDHAREEALKTWGFRLDEIEGNLPCERLVDAAYDWCAKMAERAKFEDDQIMDYFRKRIPLYMVRYGLVRALMRQFDDFKKTGKLVINDDDVAFAELIGDYIFYMQQYMFGNQVQTALETQTKDFRPRQRRSKIVDLYLSLPSVFKLSDLENLGYKKSSANSVASRLLSRNVVEKAGVGKWKKIVTDISDIVLY